MQKQEIKTETVAHKMTIDWFAKADDLRKALLYLTPRGLTAIEFSRAADQIAEQALELHNMIKNREYTK